MQTITCRKTQTLCSKAVVTFVLQAQPPPQRLQLQRLGPVLPLQLQCIDRNIGHQTRSLPLLHIQPGANRATTLLQLPLLGIKILPQCRQINLREIGKGLTAPAIHSPFMHGEQRLLETAHDRKALAPICWRSSVQSQLMAPALVAQHQIHIRQLQGRCIAYLVGPLHRAVTNGNFRLRKQPVRHRIIALAALLLNR